VREDVDLGVDEALRLSADRGGDPRMGMTGRVDGDAGREVEVLVAVDGDDPAPFSVGDLQVGDLACTSEQCELDEVLRTGPQVSGPMRSP
jgi:hypothetical protein